MDWKLILISILIVGGIGACLFVLGRYPKPFPPHMDEGDDE